MIDHVHGPAGRSRRSKYGRENLLPEDLDGTPALLAAERTRLLPEIVVHGEHDGLATDGGLDALDGSDLLILTGAGLSVAGSGGGPSGLEVESVLAWTETVDDLELRGDELTGVLGVNVGVEEGVDVAADDVDDGAEDGGVLLPDIKGLGGGHGAGVASELEGGLAGDDEGSELNAGAGSGEDGLVTDDDEVDHAPLVPGNDVGHLLGCSRDSGAADEDTEDDLESVGLASGSDVLESRAVRAVDTDGGESSLGNLSNVTGDR